MGRRLDRARHPLTLVRLRWAVLWVAAVALLAIAAAWLGMTAALYVALEPVRAIDHILTSIGV